MFKKTLTAALAALTLTTASLTISQPAEARGIGKFVAAGIVGAIIGSVLAPRSAPAYSGPAYGGCGYRSSPVFDVYGNRVGFQRVPAC